MTSVEYRVYDPTNATLLGTLTRAYARSYVEALSSPGLGRFSIDLDDSQAALVQPRRVVRVRVDGVDRFAFYIDDTPRDETGSGDDPPAMQVSGPGLAGWLGTARGGALIYPPKLATRARNRAFGWHSLDYSRPTADGWVWAGGNQSFGRQNNPYVRLPRLKGQPEGWPDPRAQWLTHRLPTLEPDGSTYHAGENEGLFSRHLPAAGTRPARIFVAGTNEWDLYFDGERIASGGGFRNVVETDVFLENRPVGLGLHVRQTREPTFKYDVLAVILTVLAVNSEGQLGGVLFRTYTPSQQPAPAPPNTWRVLADPAVIPGVSPGVILSKLIGAAKDRGTVPSLGYSTWNHVTDSNGQAWDAKVSHSFPIGTKLSDALDQLVGLAGIEYTVTPAGQLRVANRIGVTRTGAFAPLVSGRTSGEGIRATVLLGEAEDGFLERTNADRVAQYGRVEDAVTVGTQPSRAALRQPLDRMLAYTAQPRDERDFVLSGSSPQPYVNFGLGDTYVDGRVTQIAMTQDDAGGGVEWAVSLLPEGD